jgi:amino acid transporter
MAGAVNPINSFKGLAAGGNLPGSSHSLGAAVGGSTVVAGSAAIGIFFAFWSWVGYETTAVYGEESRNPKRIVPRATLIAVVGLGIFYTFVSWMVIAGNGAKQAIDKSANNSIGMFTDLAEKNLGGHWVVNIYLFLIVSGSFACALAFHNAASRYLYAIGREVPFLKNNLGATHGTHKTPYIASIVQSVITVLLTVGFYVLTPNGSDVTTGGYIFLYGLLALLGTMSILAVQAICSIAVIGYFWVKKTHTGDVFTTLISPALGALGMIYALWLLFTHLSFAGGAASTSLFYHLMVPIAVVTFLVGLVAALWLRSSDRPVYDAIGRTVLEETHERV